ncbi:UDP-glucose:undecaprenyl-phosphate glucose-1-phosphate transferase [Methylobacterium crusticola]|uniref:UDP-glucose:undecaprenyl-phosphate glucose-1-phosphate transferase n=1 Tax=Methylobacterium crusticola TaxID=1697972 RepID=A0ABQ4R5H5_9HYPH|nr:undecaprenyl-phosphate glucose phosphotransferase [Methylobacterium crusticola]GJD52054.1 UDP-glucose:undecaprenyl-phosphate glucose-1-phosphate transferase [Methylobacterium crusticola]
MSAFDVRDILKTAAEQAAAPAGRPGPAREAVPPAEAVVPARAGPALSPVVLAGCVRALEFVLVAAAGFAVQLGLLSGIVPLNLGYVAAILGLAGLTLAVLQALGTYGIRAFRAFFSVGLRVALGWSLVILLAATILFFAKLGDQYSRLWLAGFYAAGLGLLLAERLILALAVSAQMRRGRFDRRTAIVGGGEPAEALIRALEAQSDSGLRIVGVFDDRSDGRSADVVAGYPKLGTVSDLVAYARRTKLDLIVFTLPISAEARILEMLAKLWVLPIDIRLSAHATKLRLRPRSYSYLGSVPVLDVFDKPIADWDVVVKGLFDRVVGCLMLVLFSPVMLGVALAVKLTSPGPVFFRQKRYGFNNELIEVYKFRSMYVDQGDAAAAKLVTKGDARVTRVGRIIRKTSLDELPQLLNVVKGDLSLVGPRPHALQAKAANTLYDQVVDGYFARHKVKPGLTGWAQVNGWRGETDTSEKIQRRVEHDLYYIENWSVFFDIQILATTPLALLKTENAY